MVSSEYITYFATMAAVGATLFGLIFVAISITPESIASESAPLERQVKANTAYIALLNPLVISLFALVPHQQIGIVVMIEGVIGLLSTLAMILTLLQNANQRAARVRHSLFILGGFVIYGYEIYFAVRLLQSPTDIITFFALADLLIFISIYGIIRAWELIGIRQFQMKNWLSSLRFTKKSNKS